LPFPLSIPPQSAEDIQKQTHSFDECNPILFLSFGDGVSELRYRTLARFGSRNIKDFNRKSVSSEVVGEISSKREFEKIRRLKYVTQALKYLSRK
jgi:hypothetical protein